jgi:cytoskeletal protein CcmA (bactofilin family)
MLMFNRSNNRKNRQPTGPADTSLIARGTTIRGDIHFTGSLHLDGQVEGAVLADAGGNAVLTVSEVGRVVGDIRVPHAVIDGAVVGNIHVTDRLELAAQARIQGDISYAVLEMAAGAQVNGTFSHQGGTEAQRQLGAPEGEEPVGALAAEA